MEKENLKLKASDSANYGFLLFAGISVALGYWLSNTFLAFASPFLYVSAGAFGLSALISPLLLQYRETLLTSEFLEITQGTLRAKKITVPLKEIQKPSVVYIENGQKKTGLLEDFDLEKDSVSKVEEFDFLFRGEKITFHAYSFEDWVYKDFIRNFKNVYYYNREIVTAKPIKETAPLYRSEEENTPVPIDDVFLDVGIAEDNQISATIQKTTHYLSEDKKLRDELLETTNEAYSSIYEVYTWRVVRDGDELRLNKNDVAFYYSKDEENYDFYLKGKFKADVEAEEIQVGENLIATTMHNIGIVNARINVYEEILAQLRRTQTKYLQRMKMQVLADKISHLQQRNIQNAEEKDELSFDSSMIVALEELTEKLKKTDLDLYAETLIQHANLIKNNELKEEEAKLLQDLNSKIV